MTTYSDQSPSPITVALAGNPNSGKTTIFNALTGARQQVGNYPGVTVEKIEGARKHRGRTIAIVDLPGTYSLTAFTPEERVARDFLLDEKPDVVVDVVDASNLERHLYLAVQLLEMGVPLLLAFNMSDVARQRGLEFDLPMLSRLLGVPIVPTVGTQGEGIEALLDAAVEMATKSAWLPVPIRYGEEIEREIELLGEWLAKDQGLVTKYGRRWLAVKLLEQDPQITELAGHEVLSALQESLRRLTGVFRDEPAMVIADRRYGFISGACTEAVRVTAQTRHDVSDQIDSILLHRVWGIPIFLLMMYGVFEFTFHLGDFPMRGLEWIFARLAEGVGGLWPLGSENLIRSLLVDGVIAGVGGVAAFLPNILLLYAAIAFLEDSGYMARAAFLMDHWMHRIGLHGKSFIPMLIGFGCSVPAILATRILENRRNRLTTILVIPLMSCGARFPIYSLLIPAFFAVQYRPLVMSMLYLTGAALAIGCAKLLRGTVFRGETIPFVMELPPYRMPTGMGLWIHTWTRGKMYLKKAGTVILMISIVMWAATTFPRPTAKSLAGKSGAEAKAVRLENSAAGRVGRALEPAIRPLGFDWKIGTALIGASTAKEVFVSQLAIVYSLDDPDENAERLRNRLAQDYSSLQGLCILLFCLIGTPCLATVAMTGRETGSWKWAALQWGGLTALAYVVTLTVYQLGRIVVG
jgi:ferrous iron transport protein B